MFIITREAVLISTGVEVWSGDSFGRRCPLAPRGKQKTKSVDSSVSRLSSGSRRGVGSSRVFVLRLFEEPLLSLQHVSGTHVSTCPSRTSEQLRTSYLPIGGGVTLGSHCGDFWKKEKDHDGNENINRMISKTLFWVQSPSLKKSEQF